MALSGKCPYSFWPCARPVSWSPSENSWKAETIIFVPNKFSLWAEKGWIGFWWFWSEGFWDYVYHYVWENWGEIVNFMTESSVSYLVHRFQSLDPKYMCSVKQIEVPYVFDWENAIALDTMQGNRASFRRDGKVSWVFSSCGRHVGYILELWRACPF